MTYCDHGDGGYQDAYGNNTKDIFASRPCL